ncbi:MAG: hypothetical protein R2799_16355 [Crocinitomicaceae bacterium]
MSSITGFFLQLGAMMFIALFLIWFHDNSKEVTSIIGLLSLIIGVAVAHLFASLIMNYVVSDKQRKSLHQKGNNYATIVLVLGVPFAVFPMLDWMENNMTEMLYYSLAISLILIGVILSFILNFFRLAPPN